MRNLPNIYTLDVEKIHKESITVCVNCVCECSHSIKKLVVTWDARMCQCTDNEWIGVNDTGGLGKKGIVIALVNQSFADRTVTNGLVNTNP